MASFAPGSDRSGTRRSISPSGGGGWTTGGTNSAASLTTALAGANNDLTYTAKSRGTGGNSTRIRYVVAGANTPLSVSVSGSDITVNVATDGSSNPTSTANAVLAAVNASTPASALVTASLAAGNDGTGVVATLAFTSLTGGTNWVIGGGSSGFGRISKRNAFV
jgi:hypothetical protein